jgi:hypothetical protein
MTLPTEVGAVSSQYLSLTGELLPGRVQGLYRTGSIVPWFVLGRAAIASAAGL